MKPRFDRLAFGLALAGATAVEKPLVCRECKRPIRSPRRYIGEESSPVCLTCVEDSFREQEKRHAHGAG